MFKFMEEVNRCFDLIKTHEKDNIIKLSELIYETFKTKKKIYIFGTGHANLVSQEMYFRAGGSILFNPIFAPELSLTNEPVTTTSLVERLEGFGEIIASKVGFEKGDLLIVNSVSGRNSAPIEMAMYAKKKEVKVVSITNLKYSQETSSRHSSGLRLFETSDLVINNHVRTGDASVKLDSSDQYVGGMSSISAFTILNEALVLFAQRLVDENIDPLPFFVSANIDGGDQKNDEMFEAYKSLIKYRY